MSANLSQATRRPAVSLSARHGPLGGGEGRGEVGDSRALADAHLTLPTASRRVPPLSPLKGREGKPALRAFAMNRTSSASPAFTPIDVATVRQWLGRGG